jgi:hypothetical protein
VPDRKSVRQTPVHDVRPGDRLAEGIIMPEVTAIQHACGMTRVWLQGGTTFLIGTDQVLPILLPDQK